MLHTMANRYQTTHCHRTSYQWDYATEPMHGPCSNAAQKHNIQTAPIAFHQSDPNPLFTSMQSHYECTVMHMVHQWAPIINACEPNRITDDRRWMYTNWQTPQIHAPSSTVCMTGLTDDVNHIERRNRQREKQVLFGKLTPGYRRYIQLVPIEQREPDNAFHPTTPTTDGRVQGRREWTRCLKQWRRCLHNWDDSSMTHAASTPDIHHTGTCDSDETVHCCNDSVGVTVPSWASVMSECDATEQLDELSDVWSI